MILVSGATGNVGGELVANLAARGEAVRAVTRRPKAVHLPTGIEVVYGDFGDRASIDEAFRGADRAFLMSTQPPGSAAHPTHDLQLVEAAKRADVSQVVKLSVYTGGAGEDAVGIWHREAEAAVVDAGMDWTLLRPGRFMSNALRWAPMIRRGDTVAIPFAHRAAASIDPADIAAVAAVALTTTRHRNVAYQLSGPEVLTPADELRTLAETLDRPLRLFEPPIETVRAGMIGSGMAEQVVDAIVARTLEGEEGTEVLSTVAQITGRPPATFASWAEAHIQAFQAGSNAS
jgi:uncharacterized protein YbjT (DUF2867 family)